MSPETVLPLHRAVFTLGESQLDQSSSPTSSNVRGVQEKCFLAFGSGWDEFPRFWARSLKLPVDLLGVSSNASKSSLNGIGPLLVEEGRIVSSLDSDRFSLGPNPLVLFEVADMPSSPTVACLRSSTKVQRPCLKSCAICFTPGCIDGDCLGAHVARLLSAGLGLENEYASGDCKASLS